MLRILGKASSINVRKVLWSCAELQLNYELEEWGAGYRATDTAEFKALNPNALVPVLIDGDFVLWQSNSICRYLAATQPEQTLLPGDLRQRALVEQWMDWQSTELNNAWRYAFMHLVRQSPDYADSSMAAQSVISWNKNMHLLDTVLEHKPHFVTGADFSLADIVLGLSINRWLMTPIERPDLPAVAAYYQRLSHRQGFQQFCGNGIA